MEEKKIMENENSKPQFAIFDWIVSLPIIRIVKPLYEWKKAFWIYCFLGLLSTISNFDGEPTPIILVNSTFSFSTLK